MSVRKALGISAFSQLIVFLFNFGSVIAVSRLLTPEEIGIFSVSAAILTFAHIFREFGVGQYLIQAKTLDREKIRAAFTVTLGISWAIALLLYIARVPIARFYGSAGIAEVLALISINFLLIPFGSPLLSLLRREMRFDKIAIVNISNAVVSSGTTIAAAAAGMSYLSMGLGAIAGVVTNVVVLNAIRRGEIFMLPTFRGLREVVRFGSVSSTVSILTELSMSAPDLILGRTLGFSAVAYFSRANAVRKMTTGQINTLVQRVYFPSFALKVREGRRPAELYGYAINYLVAFTAPALALLALLADPLLLLLFGPQWEDAATLSSMLCVFALVTTPTSLTGTSLTACGKLRLLMRTQLLMLGVRVAALGSSLWLELEQVVMLLGVAALLGQQSQLYAMRSAFGLRIRVLWRHVRSAYVILVPCTLVGPALVLFVDRFFRIHAHPAVLLGIAVPLAVGGWIIGIVFSGHPLKMEFSRLREHFTHRGTAKMVLPATVQPESPVTPDSVEAESEGDRRRAPRAEKETNSTLQANSEETS